MQYEIALEKGLNEKTLTNFEMKKKRMIEIFA